ncbi:phospholipase C/P1 nuclease [Leucogyrophana mollusca]|uniref:Phospholipase C/P1 nuclease n=1 Tax=Leucogyrophana mollusca TaxID=85980 RepID=A0ACB8B1T2_9AGAM|nr:phospholipase C/P1 nuclease [Leucogyrophana mollusca]
MRVAALSFVLAAGSAVVPQAAAWGAAGHEIVATIAQMHLHPSVLPTLCSILYPSSNINSSSSSSSSSSTLTDPPCALAPIATWADRIRYLPQFRWTAPLHYIGARDDFPRETCAFPGEGGWEKAEVNVLRGIRNVTGVLGGWVDARRGDKRAEDALKFLVHFLGDMHMPLHLTGRDRGGNGDKVSFDGRVTNLHSLWDGLLIAQRLRTIPANYTRPLRLPGVERHLRDTIYDPYVRRLVWEGVLGRYRDEVQGWLACPDDAKAKAAALTVWERVVGWVVGGKGGDGGLGTDDETLCPYHWAAPIHALNCEIVWPPALDEPPYTHIASDDSEAHVCGHEDEDLESLPLNLESLSQNSGRGGKRPRYVELDTPEYAGVIRDEWIVEKLLTQAGIRLAAVLNWLFVEPEEGGVRRRMVVEI